MKQKDQQETAKYSYKEEQKLSYIKNVRDFFPGSKLIYLNDGSPRVIHNNKDISTILMPIPKNEYQCWMQASSWTDFKRADREDMYNHYTICSELQLAS